MTDTGTLSKTMVRTSLLFGDSTYLLSQAQDYEALKTRIEGAVRAGGAFVDFVVVGNRTVSALVTGAERVILTVETVAYDERDTGDVEYPFGSFFDEI